MIVLATAATVIASQAVITGAFSVARAAMQLGYVPRMQVRHTSTPVSYTHLDVYKRQAISRVSMVVRMMRSLQACPSPCCASGSL